MLSFVRLLPYLPVEGGHWLFWRDSLRSARPVQAVAEELVQTIREWILMFRNPNLRSV